MAKTKPGKKDLDSYTIKGTNKVVRPGDCVLMRPSDSDKPPYVARVEKIEADHRNNVKVRVRWYYRPEESIGGRRQFHGAKELFLSDHFDVQSAHTIEGKCTVHSFKNYTKLENVGAEDYFCRFEYKAATGGFTPDRVAVYCKCEMPYNPDDLMVQCEGCKDWFHPSCMGMTIEEAKKLDHFLCSDCSSDDDAKRSLNAFPVSPPLEPKRISRNFPVLLWDRLLFFAFLHLGFAGSLLPPFKEIWGPFLTVSHFPFSFTSCPIEGYLILHFSKLLELNNVMSSLYILCLRMPIALMDAVFAGRLPTDYVCD
ncbi:hypothetical protein Tsubulata_041280 [Turnera subulata]|uniref:BAH domain-containing protein n=1 Tax=Turnera subulata TaxID=218843 RepID=A0A9Q0JN74_9ROSI|nr:hypothetical protein Tsubulata_041280 [Turnera subulata]